MQNISKYITIDDFPENFKEVVEIIGIEKAIEISQAFAGTNIYVPKMDELQRKARNIKIRAEFSGSNISELAIKYSLTEVQVRTILKIKESSIEDYLEKE